MEQQRSEDYYRLINHLLTCRDGEEPKILMANPDLIDDGLVQALKQVASMMAQQGNQYFADYLIHVAEHLPNSPFFRSVTPATGVTNKASPRANSVEIPPLLDRIFKTIIESKGNPQVVYNLLQANRDKLDDNFVEQFRNWGFSTLPDAEPETAQVMATLVHEFSILMCQSPLGNRTINLEIAITGYEIATSIFTREAFPEEWAQLQTNLAPAYRHRIQGDRADNLEKGIAACLGALEVITRQSFPEQWAMIQNNLGLVYSDRIRGDLAENQEKAIACYEAASQVYTREAIPEEWGRVQNNLGIAYQKRIQGNLAENQEKAITCYEAALKIRTREALPYKWAQTQNNLGLIYSERILGDPIQNVERAITCYNAALQVQTPEAFPTESTSVQIKLEDACRHRDDLYQSGKELHFLLQIFQAVRNNRQNLQAVYPLLSANLDKLDDNFIQSFDTWTTVKLSTVDRQEAELRAVDISLFSGLIQQFPLGDRAINLEIAIRGYEIVSEIFSQQEDFLGKLVWAEILCNFSVAYKNRIRGNRAENLEKAISVCKQALTIDIRDEFPQLWAGIHNNLGGAYSNRVLGQKADNLEEAIRHFKAALKVFTREAIPSEWAKLQHNLGDAYLHRILGDRAENIEIGIKYIEAALQVYTKEKFPQDWANAQNTLAAANHERIRGDRAENLEKAIALHQAVLRVRTREACPHDWAQTQMNLANAYRNQIGNNPVENLEKAIAHYQLALQVYTQQAFPEKWAMTQNNLGMAYSKRIDDAEYQERAISAYEAALQVHTKEAFPQDWAMTQKNLGIVYSVRISGNRAENLSAAMTAFQSASQILTRNDFPLLWARNQYNQSVAYCYQGKIDEAITCCRLALELYQPNTFPVECFTTGRELGQVGVAAKRWDIAIEGYSLAIDAVETTRTWTTSESRRQEILAEAIDVYENMVQAYINDGQLEKAIEYAERSRSKRLVDLMASNDLYQGGEISPKVKELLQQFDDLQQQIDQERSQNKSGNNRELMGVGTSTLDRATFQVYNGAIASLEAEKQQLWNQIRSKDPVLAGEIQVSAPDFSAMQNLIDQPTTAILSFYTTSNDTYIFILRQNQITLHTCPGQGINTLQGWIYQNWLQSYKNDNSTWKSQISSFLSELVQRLQLSDLIDHQLTGINELILVPHLLLHQIPFAALPIGEGQYLGDRFLIRYTPSCQVLEFCQQRGEVEGNLAYGTVEDATDDLPCASFEGEQIAQLYEIPEIQRLRGSIQATRHNYRKLAEKVQVLHSCHHAKSELAHPLNSVLKLADGNITLGQLMTPGWRLPKLSDVFLSCCETGLGLPEITDDILTLSTGFLCAGARSVVSTLWSVDDLGTALFSIFYYQHRQQGKNRPEALQQAQIQLHQLKKDELLGREDVKELKKQAAARFDEAKSKRKQYQRGSADRLKWDREYIKYEKLKAQIDRLENSQQEHPFSHPCYWAAFTCSGLR